MYSLRKLTFGKYKGEYILYIIDTHIGYIMWCLENLPWFKLTDIEQKYYDWCAIAIVKYDLPMTFPVDLMCKHIKDADSYKTLSTPLIWDGYNFRIRLNDQEMLNMLTVVGVIVADTPDVDLSGLNHSFEKDAQIALEKAESEKDVFGGLEGPYCYTGL